MDLSFYGKEWKEETIPIFIFDFSKLSLALEPDLDNAAIFVEGVLLTKASTEFGIGYLHL